MKKTYEFLEELDESLMSDDLTRRGIWVPVFKDFMLTDKQYCVISFKNAKERRSCLTALRNWKRKHDLDVVFGNYGTGYRVYIAKPKNS